MRSLADLSDALTELAQFRRARAIKAAKQREKIWAAGLAQARAARKAAQAPVRKARETEKRRLTAAEKKATIARMKAIEAWLELE